MPPGYAWPENLIDSRNLSRDTRFCRCTVFKSPSCVAELFFLPLYGGFLKWWYPKTMGFPAKMIILGVFWEVPPFEETPIYRMFFLGTAALAKGHCYTLHAYAPHN